MLMHRLLLGLTDPKIEGDHFNGNGLDNLRQNLRVVTRAKQSQNRRINKNNTSGARGVNWLSDRQCWRAQVSLNGKDVFQKRFKDFNQACLAVKEARIRFLTHTNEDRERPVL